MLYESDDQFSSLSSNHPYDCDREKDFSNEENSYINQSTNVSSPILVDQPAEHTVTKQLTVQNDTQADVKF